MELTDIVWHGGRPAECTECRCDSIDIPESKDAAFPVLQRADLVDLVHTCRESMISYISQHICSVFNFCKIDTIIRLSISILPSKP
jgi:hypothetical protein